MIINTLDFIICSGKYRSPISLNLTCVQMPRYWHERNPSTFNEDALYTDGGFGLNRNESDLADRARLDISVKQLLREAKVKTKSWVMCSSFDHVDVAFKKVNINENS